MQPPAPPKITAIEVVAAQPTDADSAAIAHLSAEANKSLPQVAYVVKGKRVRTVAIAGREARRRKALSAYMKLIPAHGFAPRGTLIASKASTKRITARNSKSLVQTHEPGTFGFYCQIGL